MIKIGLTIDDKIIRTCCFTTKPMKGYRIVWEITSRCNGNCIFCFLEPKHNDLGTDDTKKIIENLINSSIDIDEIFLGGREPLLREDIFEILEYLIDYNLKISLSTNGTLIQQIKKILKYRDSIRAINTSIYCFQPGINSKILHIEKGKALDNIIMSMKNILDSEIDLKVNIPLLKENINDLNMTIEYLGKLGVNRISILPIFLVGRAKNFVNEYKNILDLSSTNLYYNLQKYCDIYDIEIIPIRIKLLKSQKFLEKCFAGLKILSILPNGKMSPCNLISNSNDSGYYNFLSSVLEDNIVDYTIKMKKFFNEENSNIENLLCNNINSGISCGGGCRAVAAIEREKKISKIPFEKFYNGDSKEKRDI